jgi:hypothetical protein
MKLILPNGEKKELDSSLEDNEKQEVVKKILEEWESYFEQYKHNRKVQTCLDILSNYLSKEKPKPKEII